MGAARYHLPEETLEAIKNHSDALAATDVFKMTPYHILALSAKPNSVLWQELLRMGPSDAVLRLRDSSRKTPVDYLLEHRHSTPGTMDLLKLVLESTVLERLVWLGKPEWQDSVRATFGNAVRFLEEEFRDDDPTNDQRFGAALEHGYKKLARYERYEVLALLEQAVWKNRLLSDAAAFVDRESCRIHCGSDIVVSNVMPFLGEPKPKFEHR